MGYSGAGKSTLLRLINMLERPDSGQVIIDGTDLTTLSASELRIARHNIGMIFQQFNLMSNQTVFDNVAFNLKISGYPSRDIHKRVMECLAIVDLTDPVLATILLSYQVDKSNVLVLPDRAKSKSTTSR